MIGRLLICTDLDRTLLPNGNQPESPSARHRFARLSARPEVSLAFGSGRHRNLVLDAINEYQLPVPDFVIVDVGTTIYSIKGNHWQIRQSWFDEIAPDWGGLQHEDLNAFGSVADLSIAGTSTHRALGCLDFLHLVRHRVRSISASRGTNLQAISTS